MLNKYLRKLFALSIVCALVLSFTTVSFAATDIDGTPRTTPGINPVTIYINDTAYNAFFTYTTSSDNAALSRFKTNCRCVRKHRTVMAVFSTTSTGKETYRGGAINHMGVKDPNLNCYVGCSGTTQSKLVRYAGSSTPIKVIDGDARIYIATVSQTGATNEYNFYVAI